MDVWRVSEGSSTMSKRFSIAAVFVLALVVSVPASAGPLCQAAGHSMSLDGLTFGLWSQVAEGLAQVGRAVDALRPERIGARPSDGEVVGFDLDGEEELRPERIGSRAKAN